MRKVVQGRDRAEGEAGRYQQRGIHRVGLWVMVGLRHREDPRELAHIFGDEQHREDNINVA